MAARPDDLTGLIDFWKNHNRIGNRLELVGASIARRLIERDQNRAEAFPLSQADALTGVRVVAAATTLAQQSTIRVPDGLANTTGIPIEPVLPGWDPKKSAALLSRPIFDEAIYGTVRFHHREAREYLTAEWFKGLLDRQVSRRTVESIFFREQYGLEVIVPTMRPVLSWLILLDDKMRERALAISPEIIFEGGEPKALPAETRRQILTDVCETLHSGVARSSTTDYRAVQRFADKDIAGHVKALLARYSADEHVTSFLLRMVWQGELDDVVPEAKLIALDPKAERYTRISAIRAVKAAGTQTDIAEIRASFIAEAKTLRRHWLAELVEGLPSTEEGVDWLLSAAMKVPAPESFAIDGLQDAIDGYVNELDLDLVERVVDGLSELIRRRPVTERRHCEVSKRFGWLLKSAAYAAERLIAAKHPAALKTPTLSILQRIPAAEAYRDLDLRDRGTEIPRLISAWTELNDALFWYEAGEARRIRRRKKKERVTHLWQVSLFGGYWRFEPSDFERVLPWMNSQPLLDDRRLSLSLAFKLYVQAGRPAKWRRAMARSAGTSRALRQALHDHLHPGPRTSDQKRWRRQEAHYNRRWREREQANAEAEQRWKESLRDHLELLREGLPDRAAVSNHQYWLHEEMRKADPQSHHWTVGTWRGLESEFGVEIATAFRDGAVAYWRRYQPRLRSEGKVGNTTPFSVIFGLTGLNIEARETPNWPSSVQVTDAETAFRYAMDELNGFPDWMPSLFEKYPEQMLAMLFRELDYDLRIESIKSESHYVLYDMNWNGAWAWQRIGDGILTRLKAREPKNLSNLGYMLNIIHGAGISDAEIAELAAERSTERRLDHSARWFAVWTGVDPDQAIPAVSARLNSIKSAPRRTRFAMQFITHLLGGRRSDSKTREAFRTADHLKNLYALIHRHVRQSEDIQRAGKGVYSPTLRDDAQDARNQLFSLLKEIPGKEAFLALMELSKLHPDQSLRPWMLHHAKSKAELDADLTPWSIEQTLEFQEAIERTPTNHRELFELVELRFLDLKDNLEHGDSSIADILLKGATQETEMRTYIGEWLRDRAAGRYAIPQEEQLVDARRMDLRVHGNGFDGPVPVELKLADKWTGSKLFERLQNQLCGDYLRDIRSNRGLFVLVYRGEKGRWDHPETGEVLDFNALVEALQKHWLSISSEFPDVDDVRVVGIDLMRRSASPARG